MSCWNLFPYITILNCMAALFVFITKILIRNILCYQFSGQIKIKKNILIFNILLAVSIMLLMAMQMANAFRYNDNYFATAGGWNLTHDQSNCRPRINNLLLVSWKFPFTDFCIFLIRNTHTQWEYIYDS